MNIHTAYNTIYNIQYIQYTDYTDYTELYIRVSVSTINVQH